MNPAKFRGLFFGRITIRNSSIAYCGLTIPALTLFPWLFLMGGPGAADLVIRGSGFTHAGGQAVARIFRPGEELFGKPYRQVISPIGQGGSLLVFNGLPHGQLRPYNFPR